MIVQKKLLSNQLKVLLQQQILRLQQMFFYNVPSLNQSDLPIQIIHHSTTVFSNSSCSVCIINKKNCTVFFTIRFNISTSGAISPSIEYSPQHQQNISGVTFFCIPLILLLSFPHHLCNKINSSCITHFHSIIKRCVTKLIINHIVFRTN